MSFATSNEGRGLADVNRCAPRARTIFRPKNLKCERMLAIKNKGKIQKSYKNNGNLRKLAANQCAHLSSTVVRACGLACGLTQHGDVWCWAPPPAALSAARHRLACVIRLSYPTASGGAEPRDKREST